MEKLKSLRTEGEDLLILLEIMKLIFKYEMTYTIDGEEYYGEGDKCSKCSGILRWGMIHNEDGLCNLICEDCGFDATNE